MKNLFRSAIALSLLFGSMAYASSEVPLRFLSCTKAIHGYKTKTLNLQQEQDGTFTLSLYHCTTIGKDRCLPDNYFFRKYKVATTDGINFYGEGVSLKPGMLGYSYVAHALLANGGVAVFEFSLRNKCYRNTF